MASHENLPETLPDSRRKFPRDARERREICYLSESDLERLSPSKERQ